MAEIIKISKKFFNIHSIETLVTSNFSKGDVRLT